MAKKKQKHALRKVTRPKQARRGAKATATPSGLSIQQQFEQSVQALMRLEPSEIEVILGQQLSLTNEELRRTGSLSAARPDATRIEDSSQLAAAPIWLRDLGRLFLKKFSAQMYSLLCDTNDPDNAKVVQAAADGAEKLALVLSGVLVSAFGWLPAIAVAVGVIIAKRAAKAGHEALCISWKQTLT